ncbi:MAG TPA: tRNA (guanosine(46)-N7)-methyltransferase TrmB [Gammaproteobacteria bacterium]
MTQSTKPLRQIRSFVLREGRLTAGQQRALEELWPRYGIDADSKVFDFVSLFGRAAPVVFEIGFGDGESLAQTASTYPDLNFIGVEVHRPGVGHLLQLTEQQSLANIRIVSRDAVEVLKENIADGSLYCVDIFFPDPWHKKRHHKRRLVQPDFVALLSRKLQHGGILHVATDWEDYARHVETVMTGQNAFTRASPEAALSRPETKFERRGQRLGHGVWDLVYRNSPIP